LTLAKKEKTVMKKLKLISALAVTGFITMSMGFPTDLTNGRITNKKEKKTCGTISRVVVMATAHPGRQIKNIEEKPVQELSISLTSEYSTITVKVFDAKGTLITKQKVSIEEFLGTSEQLSLPTGSTFVMFHEGIAYYFLEAGQMNLACFP
jgi:hypothetical protein